MPNLTITFFISRMNNPRHQDSIRLQPGNT